MLFPRHQVIEPRRPFELPRRAAGGCELPSSGMSRRCRHGSWQLCSCDTHDDSAHGPRRSRRWSRNLRHQPGLGCSKFVPTVWVALTRAGLLEVFLGPRFARCLPHDEALTLGAGAHESSRCLRSYVCKRIAGMFSVDALKRVSRQRPVRSLISLPAEVTVLIAVPRRDSCSALGIQQCGQNSARGISAR